MILFSGRGETNEEVNIHSVNCHFFVLAYGCDRVICSQKYSLQDRNKNKNRNKKKAHSKTARSKKTYRKKKNHTQILGHNIYPLRTKTQRVFFVTAMMILF